MSSLAPGPVASAPGKVLLAGEYAVLEGAEAVVLAVDRRARAGVTSEEQSLEGFLAAARDQVAAHSGAASAAAAAAARVAADSSALCAPDGTKLGLGSSAAVTVAAVAAALAVDRAAGRRGEQPRGGLDRALVHRLAHRAHALAQAELGARGSGADVAAAALGGLLAVQQRSADPDEPLCTRSLALPAGLELVFVWTGEPAHTAGLVARVLAYRDQDAERYRRCIDRITSAALALSSALADNADPGHAVAAVAAGGDAIANLGRVTGLALETTQHRRVRAIAERCGGAFKPTGAGAGDMGVAAFGSAEAALCFRHDAAEAGISITDLGVDPTGVRIE